MAFFVWLLLSVRLTCEEGFSRSGATAQRKSRVFLCAFAPLRETFFGVGGTAVRFCAGAFGVAVRVTVADIRTASPTYRLSTCRLSRLRYHPHPSGHRKYETDDPISS